MSYVNFLYQEQNPKEKLQGSDFSHVLRVPTDIILNPPHSSIYKTQKCKCAVEKNQRNALKILNVLTDVAPILLASCISQWLWGAKKYTQRLKKIEAKLRKVFLVYIDTRSCSQEHKA